MLLIPHLRLHIKDWYKDILATFLLQYTQNYQQIIMILDQVDSKLDSSQSKLIMEARRHIAMNITKELFTDKSEAKS